jgi:UDP-N-acetylmuramate--alanine ligase
MQKSLKDYKNVYVIGIGGIGISAVAILLKNRGIDVRGSDRESSKVTDNLSKIGIGVCIGDDKKDIPENCDCVIHTAAISENHPQLIECKKRNILVLNYSQAIGLISKDFDTIAISGTHGKTTTTAMTAKVLIDSNLSPTVIVGSLMKDSFGNETNFINGGSKYLVIEADEYKKSFLSLYPKILAITNIDEDHLDFYKDLDDIQDAFIELVKRVPQDGYLICNKNNQNLKRVIEQAKCNVIDYGDIQLDYDLKVPGSHNRENAKVAIAIGQSIGLNNKESSKILSSFENVWRRFEYKGEMESGAKVYDDYAHNPQKVNAVLSGAKEYFGKDKRIIAVFQPHLFSRTKTLLNEFSKSFDSADTVVLSPIYSAREEFDPSISSNDLAEKLLENKKDVKFFETFDQIIEFLKYNTKKDDIVILIGAGDIYKISDNLLQKK